jgi:hypothetical protein
VGDYCDQMMKDLEKKRLKTEEEINEEKEKHNQAKLAMI